MLRYVALSGGGPRGAALCGAMDAWLAARGRAWADTLRGAAGTSIGAVLAVALCTGHDAYVAVRHLIRQAEFWDADALASSALGLAAISERGLCGHARLDTLVARVLTVCGLPADVTLAELDKRTGRRFVCNTFCVEDAREVLLDAASSPALPLRQALRMSMCVPLVFTPVRHEGRTYVDGGLARNFLSDVFPARETLGLALMQRLPIAADGHLLRFGKALFDALHAYVDRLRPQHGCAILALSTGSTPVDDIGASQADLDALYASGATCALAQLLIARRAMLAALARRFAQKPHAD